MSSNQQTVESLSVPGSSRDVAPQNARYRRFRNAPKKQLRVQKSSEIIGTAEIQDTECNNAEPSASKHISSQNVKDKGK